MLLTDQLTKSAELYSNQEETHSKPFHIYPDARHNLYVKIIAFDNKRFHDIFAILFVVR